MVEEVDLFPCAIQEAKFLKSQDRIVFCGNQLNSLSQITVVRHTEGKSVVETTCSLRGSAYCLEVCSLRDGMLLACGLNSGNGEGSIVLCNVRHDGMGYADIEVIPDGMETLMPLSPIQSSLASLAFDEYNHVLAQGRDNGVIMCNDLSTGQLIHQFKSDSTGIATLSYKHAATLICTTRSLQCPMKIYDLRMSNPEVYRVFKTDATDRTQLDAYYTAVCSHKINETVACGSSKGDILTWDLRSSGDVAASRADGVHCDKGE